MENENYLDARAFRTENYLAKRIYKLDTDCVLGEPKKLEDFINRNKYVDYTKRSFGGI